jgi:hypothetical protein
MTNRKIDALVAEKVMGWTRAPHGFLHEGVTFQVCPNYSTNIQDAWAVLDELHSKGFGWCIEQAPSMTESTCWLVAEGIHAVEKHAKASVTAVSPPMAICLAALKACGVET